MTGNVYRCDIQYLVTLYGKMLQVEPKIWMCPCDDPRCSAGVVYARGSDGRLYFQSNQTFQAKPPYIGIIIDNVEDLAGIQTLAALPRGDRAVFQAWLTQGLKEAILSA